MEEHKIDRFLIILKTTFEKDIPQMKEMDIISKEISLLEVHNFGRWVSSGKLSYRPQINEEFWKNNLKQIIVFPSLRADKCIGKVFIFDINPKAIVDLFLKLESESSYIENTLYLNSFSQVGLNKYELRSQLRFSDTYFVIRPEHKVSDEYILKTQAEASSYISFLENNIFKSKTYTHSYPFFAFSHIHSFSINHSKVLIENIYYEDNKKFTIEGSILDVVYADLRIEILKRLKNNIAKEAISVSSIDKMANNLITDNILEGKFSEYIVTQRLRIINLVYEHQQIIKKYENSFKSSFYNFYIDDNLIINNWTDKVLGGNSESETRRIREIFKNQILAVNEAINNLSLKDEQIYSYIMNFFILKSSQSNFAIQLKIKRLTTIAIVFAILSILTNTFSLELKNSLYWIYSLIFKKN
jgi:hypothetical protein